ncbi:ankyrin [Aspergillus indologenus CBS 114.80]|uniref:Ankyrin n=1 Tax=Aspergillus indologenus CBS 114.80 TaxID=1450541 RepID=A0A2V5IIG5_9EURO|nr:ankyrin [Aspergillus indologenus CBS 114.80]
MLTDLPLELLIHVAHVLNPPHALDTLVQTSHFLHASLNPILYRAHVRQHSPRPPQALWWAAENGRLQTIHQLLAAGASLSSPPVVKDISSQGPTDSEDDEDDDSSEEEENRCHPIFLAAEAGHGEVVDFLLSQGVSPDIEDRSGSTLLCVAVRNQHFHMAESLLQRGANPWQCNDTQVSAMGWAVTRDTAGTRNEPRFVPLLLHYGEKHQVIDPSLKAVVLQEGLLKAFARSGTEHIARMLLAAGADPNFLGRKARVTPLANAVGLRNFAMVKLLVEEAGGDLNLLNARQEGPLSEAAVRMHGFWWKVDDGTFHYAALSRRCRRSPARKTQVDAEAMAEMVAITAFLLDLGADIRRGGGDLALANAIKSRNAELAQFLQARGARV